MRIGIKGKQVLGVTLIVGAVVVVLSLMHLARLARVSLEESTARAELLASAIFHRAREVVTDAPDPYAALANDPGLRSILESSLYSKNVTFAAVADAAGRAVAHADPTQQGQFMLETANLSELVSGSSLTQLREIYADQGRNFEVRQALRLGSSEFGSIRIGVSTLLIRRDLTNWLLPATATALAALGIAVFGAMVLAQLLLRPIHVIRSGLTRLGRGEFGVRLDLNPHDEFGELGTFFNTVSAQLSADRSQIANLESAVERLEDAVAIVNAGGELLFANPAMRTVLPGAETGRRLDALLPDDHPLRRLAEETLMTRRSGGPVSATFGERNGRDGADPSGEASC
jgi:methyl-accepting chemotaxis protein